MFVLKEKKKTLKINKQKTKHKKRTTKNPQTKPQANKQKKKGLQRYFSFIKSYIKKPKILPGVFGVLVAETIVPNQAYLLLFLCWGFISVIRSCISLPPLMSELVCSLSPFLARSESLQITPRMPRRHISKRGIFQFFLILLSKGEAHTAHSTCELLRMEGKSRKRGNGKKREQGAEAGWSLGWPTSSSPLPGCLSSSSKGPEWCSNLSFC